MKKVFLLVLMAMFATIATNAQKQQSPKGLYRLKQFIYEDGRTRNPGYYSYKYAADSVGLLISYSPSPNITQWGNMQVEIREHYPLKYTGEKLQGSDGHGTQIYDVDDNKFLFKWYNDKWPGMSSLNEFIIEEYTKSDIQQEVEKAFNLFENKIDAKVNKFFGWWLRVGATTNPDGTGKRTAVPTIWKAYGPELSLVVTVFNNGNVLRCNPTSTVKYENDSTLYEIGHPCNIHWLNDNTHALTFVQENGIPLTEIWIRAGLPKEWQKVFNTDIETYRNGVDCIKEAVEAVLQDDLRKTESLMDEAINKDVSIEVLGEGTAAIASHLLVNKQQYKDCMEFCERQLKVIKDYADAGHDQTIISKTHVNLTEVFKAIATYRNGDTEKGKKLMEERLSIIESEIERYNSIKGMERYINLLYYCSLMMYSIGYDIFGPERTLLYLDALSLMAPALTSVPQNKSMIMKCRANCYLLNGDKESADKLLQQAKELE